MSFSDFLTSLYEVYSSNSNKKRNRRPIRKDGGGFPRGRGRSNYRSASRGPRYPRRGGRGNGDHGRSWYSDQNEAELQHGMSMGKKESIVSSPESDRQRDGGDGNADEANTTTHDVSGLPHKRSQPPDIDSSAPATTQPNLSDYSQEVHANDTQQHEEPTLDKEKEPRVCKGTDSGELQARDDEQTNFEEADEHICKKAKTMIEFCPGDPNISNDQSDLVDSYKNQEKEDAQLASLKALISESKERTSVKRKVAFKNKRSVTEIIPTNK